jgi:hypothetical protein
MPAAQPITADDRKAKRAEKALKDQQARELAQQESNIKNAQFMAELPIRIFKLMARANSRHNVTVEVKGGTKDNLLRAEFYFREDGDRDVRAQIVYLEYFSEGMIWEVPDLETKFDDMDAADAEAARLRALAQETYDSLTDDQRNALGLRRRP